MAIYLDNQTRPYLERLIKKQIEKSDKDFIAKRIRGLLESDARRLQQISECEHEYGEYKGIQHCCVKCGAIGVGMGTTWSLSKNLTVKEIQEFTLSVKPPDLARGRLFPNKGFENNKELT